MGICERPEVECITEEDEEGISENYKTDDEADMCGSYHYIR